MMPSAGALLKFHVGLYLKHMLFKMNTTSLFTINMLRTANFLNNSHSDTE